MSWDQLSLIYPWTFQAHESCIFFVVVFGAGGLVSWLFSSLWVGVLSLGTNTGKSGDSDSRKPRVELPLKTWHGGSWAQGESKRSSPGKYNPKERHVVSKVRGYWEIRQLLRYKHWLYQQGSSWWLCEEGFHGGMGVETQLKEAEELREEEQSVNRNSSKSRSCVVKGRVARGRCFQLDEIEECVKANEEDAGEGIISWERSWEGRRKKVKRTGQGTDWKAGPNSREGSLFCWNRTKKKDGCRINKMS